MGRKALLLLADDAIDQQVAAVLTGFSCEIVRPKEPQVLASLIASGDFDFGIGGSALAGKSLFGLLERCALEDRKPWLLLSPTDTSREELRRLRVLESLPTSPSSEAIESALQNLFACIEDPVHELVDTLEFISGVQLKKEKSSLVESRLRRRQVALGMASIGDYAKHFRLHQADELRYAISAVTTHTTEFFREEEHFDFLYDQVFPEICKGDRVVKIWSAASSTGQEAYSIAISLFEYLRVNGLPADRAAKQIQVFATDIDVSSVAAAREGVFKKDLLATLPREILERYFDVGSGELAEYVRIKDFVHAVCRFEQLNLMSPEFPRREFDVVFLRNAMIYFKASDIAAIVTRIAGALKPTGLLFLGHSESLAGLETPYRKVGDSIYALGEAKAPQAVRPRVHAAENSPQLLAIGASTGGVEALKVVLEMFTDGCPPILIVQHIPAGFSAALAKRLNETCRIRVSEAIDGEKLESSHAYVAPGGKQMRIRRSASGFFIEITDDPPMGLHKPSVDYLFESLIRVVGKTRLAAALLTGMGSDGAGGLRRLRQNGAHTVVQDQATSVVFGMPGAAVELEAADEIVPLQEIAAALLGRIESRKKRSAS